LDEALSLGTADGLAQGGIDGVLDPAGTERVSGSGEEIIVDVKCCASDHSGSI
jgi:hypothetical protein